MGDVFKTAFDCNMNRDQFDGKFDCSAFVQYCYSQNGKVFQDQVLKYGIKANQETVL